MVKVGVLGATGMVGQRFIQLLADHPDFEIAALAASGRSAGKKYEDATTWYMNSEMPESVRDITVIETDPAQMDKDVEIVFSSLPADFAAKVEPEFAKDFVVASNASAMIVTNPNCSTIALTLTLKPIYDNFNINRIYVSTMQAVSGAGYNGVPSMAIVDNLVPYIGGEEEKMESETLHLLGSLDGDEVVPANFSLSASCHRVPVIDGHTEAVFVELDDEADIDKIKKTMADFRGLPQELGLHSAPDQPVIVKEEDDRPQPRMDRMAYGGMAATVGRVRKDQAFDFYFEC